MVVNPDLGSEDGSIQHLRDHLDAVEANHNRVTPITPTPLAVPLTTAHRRRLPDERPALTHKFNVGDQEGYLTAGFYEDGRIGELFLRLAKEGSTVSGFADAFATVFSIALQFGVPLTALTNKLIGATYEPMGLTGRPSVPTASSVTDYVARVLDQIQAQQSGVT